VTRLALSASSSSTTAPNTTLPPAFNVAESMICAVESAASIWPMRPSMKPCCSRAAWYSAFSLRSPCARASAIAAMTRGRSTDFSCSSSARRRSEPALVMGARCMCRTPFCYTYARRLAPAVGSMDATVARSGRRDGVAGRSGCMPLQLRMQFLQADHAALVAVVERMQQRRRTRDGGRIGDVLLQRRAPDRERVGDRLAAFGGVDDVGDLAVLDRVDDVRPAFEHLVDAFAGDAVFDQERTGAAGRDQREPTLDQVARDFQQARLVGVAHRQEHLAAGGGRRDMRRFVAACERFAETLAHAHHFAGRAHLGPE